MNRTPVEYGPMIVRALEVRGFYRVLEELLYDDEWTGEDITFGLAKHVLYQGGLVAELADLDEELSRVDAPSADLVAARAKLHSDVLRQLGDNRWSLFVIGVRYAIALPGSSALPTTASIEGDPERVAPRFGRSVAQVMELVQVKEGKRLHVDVDVDVDVEFTAKLADALRLLDELCVLYEIDIEASFFELMDQLEDYVNAKIAEAEAG